MTEWREHRQRAVSAACEPQATPAVITQALGAVYAHALLGRPPLRVDNVMELRERGALALAELAEQVLAGREDSLLRLELGIARAGLSALRGQFADRPPGFAEAFLPESDRVVDLLAGRLDGLSAARVAGALCRDAQALARARALAQAMDASFEDLMDDYLGEAPAPTAGASDRPGVAPAAVGGLRLAAAADDVKNLRDPSTGVRVGRMDSPALEAILFRTADEIPRLALYAAEAKALRLEAEGATTEDMQPGYWLGRIAADVHQLEAKVFLGEHELDWRLDLDTDTA